jgi:hypothetical protein
VLKLPGALVNEFCTLAPDICRFLICTVDRDGVVGNATLYGLDSPLTESR